LEDRFLVRRHLKLILIILLRMRSEECYRRTVADMASIVGSQP